MPTSPKSACRQPGCAGRGERKGYCVRHSRDRERRRGTSAERGYDGNWRRLRKVVLCEEPVCRSCAAEGRVTAAVEVDHIVPVSAGGARLDRVNLQPLCKSHHSAKTLGELRERAYEPTFSDRALLALWRFGAGVAAVAGGDT